MSAVAIFGLTGQSAIVTGGACGIGRGIAEPLAAVTGAIADIAPEDETLAAVKVLGRSGVASHLNMSRPDEVAQFADLIRSNFNAVAIVVKSGWCSFASVGCTEARSADVRQLRHRGAADRAVPSPLEVHGERPLARMFTEFPMGPQSIKRLEVPEDLTSTALVPRRRRFRLRDGARR